MTSRRSRLHSAPTPRWLFAAAFAVSAWAGLQAPAHAQSPGLTPQQSHKPWAQGVSEDQRRRAHELFLAGTQLIKEGLFADAATRYRDALALLDHPAIHYNMAIAQLNLDQPIDAYASLEKAMQHGAEAIGPEKYEHARTYRAILEKQLARVEVTCTEPDARVTLDGKLLFTGPGSHQGLIRPGGHQLVASKDGHLTVTRPIVLSPGDHQRVDVALLPVSTLTGTRRWATWKPWAVVAGGVAVAVVGGGLQLRARGDLASFDGEFDQRCPGGCVEASPDDSLGRARGYQLAAVSAYAAGGLTIAAGLVLVYLNRVQRHDPAEIPARGVSLVPSASPDQATVSARVRF